VNGTIGIGAFEVQATALPLAIARWIDPLSAVALLSEKKDKN
jgi:hypothetical protein